MMVELNEDTVVISGCGWVTPFAAGAIHDVLRGLAGRRTTAPERGSHWNVPDDVLADFTDLPAECKRDRGVWIAAVALDLARRSADLEPDTVAGARTGMVLGCALAGQLGMIDFAEDVREQSTRFVSPIRFPQTVGNYIAGALARTFGIRGPNTTLACGAASGLAAIIEGCSLLRTGAADVVFAGGVESISEPLARALNEAGKALSEGACVFTMERFGNAERRGASVLAMIPDHTGAYDLTHATTDTADRIVSTAGRRYPGAVFIDDRIGHCLAASGAATVAAAIGAVWGCDVPWIDTRDPNVVIVRPAEPGAFNQQDGFENVTALVTADADFGGPTTIELAVPRRPGARPG